MRIIGKRDYYDSVQAYGQDQSVVFVRDELKLDYKSAIDFIGAAQKTCVRSVEFYDALKSKLGIEDGDRQLPWRRRHWRWQDPKGRSRPYIIGFCGHFYPCIEFQGDLPSESLDEVVFWLYSRDCGSGYPHLRKYYNCDDSFDHAVNKFDRFLGKVPKPSDELFHKAKSPILIFDISKSRHQVDKDPLIVINGSLRKVGFFRVMDAFSTFQAIEQYISGVLGLNDREIVTISDKDRRDSKGFDDWSFKKRPKR